MSPPDYFLSILSPSESLSRSYFVGYPGLSHVSSYCWAEPSYESCVLSCKLRVLALDKPFELTVRTSTWNNIPSSLNLSVYVNLLSDWLLNRHRWSSGCYLNSSYSQRVVKEIILSLYLVVYRRLSHGDTHIGTHASTSWTRVSATIASWEAPTDHRQLKRGSNRLSWIISIWIPSSDTN